MDWYRQAFTRFASAISFYALAVAVLVAAASSVQSGTLVVGAGSALIGTGTVNADITVTAGGRINPGAGSIGCLTVTSLVLAPGSTLEASANGTVPCGEYDSVIVTGSATALQSSLQISSGGGYLPAFSDELVLLQVGGSAGGFAPFLLNGAARETVSIGGIAMSIETTGGDGNDVSLVYRRRPSDPLILSSEVADEGEIDIRFDIENPGASPITSVTAQCIGGGLTLSSAGSVGAITVVGLDSETSYVCTVSATNQDGTSQSLATLPLTPFTIASGLPIWLLFEAAQ